MRTVERQWCSRCGQKTLRILYPDNHDEAVGAVCDNCQFRGYFSNDRLVTVGS